MHQVNDQSISEVNMGPIISEEEARWIGIIFGGMILLSILGIWKITEILDWVFTHIHFSP